MPKTQSRLQLRDQKIADEYIRQFFSLGRRDEVIFEELADLNYLQPDTIRKIVLKQSKQVEDQSTKTNQLELF